MISYFFNFIHISFHIDEEHDKKLLDIVKYSDAGQVGVSIPRYNTCKSNTRGWQFFQSI